MKGVLRHGTGGCVTLKCMLRHHVQCKTQPCPYRALCDTHPSLDSVLHKTHRRLTVRCVRFTRLSTVRCVRLTRLSTVRCITYPSLDCTLYLARSLALCRRRTITTVRPVEVASVSTEQLRHNAAAAGAVGDAAVPPRCARPQCQAVSLGRLTVQQ